MEPKGAKLPLVRGTIIHEMIEEWVKNNKSDESWLKVLANFKDEYDDLMDEEKAELGDLPEELLTLMKGYIHKYQDDKLTYLAIEKEISIPLIKGVVFTGKVDGIVEDEHGNQWIVEHKSHKTLPDSDVRLQDVQTTLYCWALRKEGYNPQGVLWDYIRTKRPSIPKALKGGGLSKRKDIDTTYEVYLEEIEKQGLNPTDYQDILEILKKKNKQFYRRVYYPLPSEHQLSLMVKDLKESAKMIRKYGDKLEGHHLSNYCNLCSYRTICQAELFNLDKEFIIKSSFKPRLSYEEREIEKQKMKDLRERKKAKSKALKERKKSKSLKRSKEIKVSLNDENE